MIKPVKTMEPARSIIELLGGPPIVSRVTRTAYTAPYRWQYPRQHGGTDGIIPPKYHRALLALARRRGVKLSRADFLPRVKVRKTDMNEARRAVRALAA